MVCVIVKATKFYASLESLGRSRPHLLEASLCSINQCIASRLKFTTTDFLMKEQQRLVNISITLLPR